MRTSWKLCCRTPPATVALLVAVCLTLAGCASVKVQKIGVDGNPVGPNGLRYYMPRPYVSVHEPFIIASTAYLVPGELTLDGQYLRLSEVPTPLAGKVVLTPQGKALLRAAEVRAAGTAGVGGTPQNAAPATAAPTVVPTPTPGKESGTATLKMTNDNAAFAVTPQRRYFDILWLPDFDEQYVVQTEARLGIASTTMRTGQGWSLQGLDASIDNSALAGPLLDLYKGSLDALQKLAVARIQGPAALISGQVQSAAPSAKEAFSGGTPLTVKITLVRVVAPGLYPVLKPRELEALKDRAATIAAAADRVLAPVPPLTNIAFNTYEVILLEAARPSGDSALRISQYVDSGSPPPGVALPVTGGGGDLGAAQASLNEALVGQRSGNAFYVATLNRSATDSSVNVSLRKSGSDAVDAAFRDRIKKLVVATLKDSGLTVAPDKVVFEN